MEASFGARVKGPGDEVARNPLNVGKDHVMKPEERLHNRFGFGVPLFDKKNTSYLVVSLATVLASSGGALRDDTKTAAREITFPPRENPFSLDFHSQ